MAINKACQPAASLNSVTAQLLISDKPSELTIGRHASRWAVAPKG
jgi:hypothetical protein